MNRGDHYAICNRPYMRDKTKDERFFILSLFAIAKELRQREALQPMVEAELAIDLPRSTMNCGIVLRSISSGGQCSSNLTIAPPSCLMMCRRPFGPQ